MIFKQTIILTFKNNFDRQLSDETPSSLKDLCEALYQHSDIIKEFFKQPIRSRVDIRKSMGIASNAAEHLQLEEIYKSIEDITSLCGKDQTKPVSILLNAFNANIQSKCAHCFPRILLSL